MDNQDGESLLTRTVTFKAPAAKTHSHAPITATGVISKIWESKAPPNNRVSESLDYEPVQNKVFYDRMRVKKEGKKKLYGYTGHTLAKFLVTFLTGIGTGLFAVAMSKSVGFLINWKLKHWVIGRIPTLCSEYDKYMPASPPPLMLDDSVNGTLVPSSEEGRECIDSCGHCILSSFFLFWMFGSILVSFATCLVQYWAPASAGGGVTLVMAYLNGNHIPNLLRFNTLVSKFVGTVCAVSAGLPMGPEGPMVHIGACVASVITYMDCKCLQSGWLGSCFGRPFKELNIKEKIKVLDEIVSDSDHREFVSAGVSAGISAAFGAPVGGVLFSMEEACSFWSRKTAWRCFIAASLSTFTIQLLNKSAVHGMIGFSNLQAMENKDWLMQLPFLLFNFGMAGLLGAAFNSMRMWLWKLRAAKTRHVQRVAEVIGLVFLVALCGFFFAWAAGTCLKAPEEWYEKDGELEYGLKFTCPEGYYNDVATLWLSSQHHTIIQLFSMGREDSFHDDPAYQPYFTKGALALTTVLYLILMSIGAGVAIPGGLFMPSIFVGASWGGLWGLIVRGWLPHWNVQPGLYAILAATSTLGGVFRSAISLVVLMVEGTRGVDYLFGVILAVVTANWVAHHIHHDGVYESELERTGNVYMLRDEAPHRLQTITVESMMATGVYGFRTIESVTRIMETLRNTTHNGFPVFSTPENDQMFDPEVQDKPGEPARAGTRLEGLILRSQLLVLLQRRHFCNAEGEPVGREASEKVELELENEMRTFYRRYYTHNRFVSALAEPLDALKLDTQDALWDISNLYLDLRPYMNRSIFTIRKGCSAARAHQAFVSLGMRHLLVVDGHNTVVGIITRKDLDHAAGHGWWRLSHMAEPPKNKLFKHIQEGANLLFAKVPSVGFFNKLMHREASDPNAAGEQANGHEQPERKPKSTHRVRYADEDEEQQGLKEAENGEISHN